MFHEELLERILVAINRLEHKQEALMATQQEFDAALDSLIAAEAARDATVTKALKDLMDKVSSGGVKPADFTAELGKVQALQTASAAATAEATADDPGPTVITPA